MGQWPNALTQRPDIVLDACQPDTRNMLTQLFPSVLHTAGPTKGPAGVAWALQFCGVKALGEWCPMISSPHLCTLYVLLAALQVACHRKSGKIQLTEEMRI